MDLAGDFEPRSFPWRTVAFVTAAIAVAELAVLLAFAGVKLAPRLHDVFSPPGRSAATAVRTTTPPASTTATKAKAPAAAAPATPAKAHVAAHPLRPRSRLSVLVLNGNGVAHAAGNEAARVLRLGYRAATPANAPNHSYGRSLVLFAPGYEREGKRLGHDLGIGIVGPLDGLTPSQIKGSQLVVILGDS